MSHPNQQILEGFYQAFQNGDADKMASYYHPDIQFEDPAFGPLKGKQVTDMWRMLLERGKGNISITYSDVQANETTGAIHWEAKYPFSKTGRKVHNKIDATFEFKDGKIYRHKDVFDIWKWSSQALGLTGMLLGFTPLVKNKIRKQSLSLLESYQGKK